MYRNPYETADRLEAARERYSARRRPELRRLLAERPLSATLKAGPWSTERGHIPVMADLCAWVIESIDDHERALAELVLDPGKRIAYVARYVEARAAADADAMSAEDFDQAVA